MTASLAAWGSAYETLGLHVWPGYIRGQSKVPCKAPELLRRRVSFLEQVTTQPADGWDWKTWGGARAVVGHVPGMARVPLVVVDLDTELCVSAWREATGEEEGRESVPVTMTGRGLHAYYRMPEDLAELPVRDRPGQLPAVTIPGSEKIAMAELTCEVLAAGKWVVLPPSKHPSGGWYRRGGLWGESPFPGPEQWPMLPGWAAEPLRRAGTAGGRRVHASSGLASEIRAALGDDDPVDLIRKYHKEQVAAGTYRGGGTAALSAALEALTLAPVGERTHLMLRVTRALSEACAWGLAGPDEVDDALEIWHGIKPGASPDDDFRRALAQPLTDSRAEWSWTRGLTGA